jgi:hypothetical protein
MRQTPMKPVIFIRDRIAWTVTLAERGHPQRLGAADLLVYQSLVGTRIRAVGKGAWRTMTPDLIQGLFEAATPLKTARGKPVLA